MIGFPYVRLPILYFKLFTHWTIIILPKLCLTYLVVCSGSLPVFYRGQNSLKLFIVWSPEPCTTWQVFFIARMAMDHLRWSYNVPVGIIAHTKHGFATSQFWSLRKWAQWQSFTLLLPHYGPLAFFCGQNNRHILHSSSEFLAFQCYAFIHAQHNVYNSPINVLWHIFNKKLSEIERWSRVIHNTEENNKPRIVFFQCSRQYHKWQLGMNS